MAALADLLALEERSGKKYEFLDGDVFEMESGTFRHARIITHLLGAVRPALNAGGCEIYTSSLRVATARKGLYTHPDLTIVSGNPAFWDTDPDTLANPRIIIEVLSPATEDHDRGKKFERYRALASFAEYIAIHQDEPFVEQWVKQPNGKWLLEELRGKDSTLRFAAVPAEIPFAAIHADVAFDQ